MAFHPMKPETIARRAAERKIERIEAARYGIASAKRQMKRYAADMGYTAEERADWVEFWRESAERNAAELRELLGE